MADAANVRSLVPRIRRALGGPAGSAVDLTDDQLKDLAADAIADVILYTGGLFGHQLVVLARDDVTAAPVEWSVDPELTEIETAVIASQTALNYFYFSLRDLKVQETIRDEGQEWSYSLSANAMRDWIKGLQDARDRALAAVERMHPIPTTYTSFLAVRDQTTSWAIEPWVDPQFVQPRGLAAGQTLDPRGFG